VKSASPEPFFNQVPITGLETSMMDCNAVLGPFVKRFVF
jgi:hypothetical protein